MHAKVSGVRAVGDLRCPEGHRQANVEYDYCQESCLFVIYHSQYVPALSFLAHDKRKYHECGHGGDCTNSMFYMKIKCTNYQLEYYDVQRHTCFFLRQCDFYISFIFLLHNL